MPEHVNLVSAGSHEDVEEAAAAAGCNGSQSLFSSATRSANRCFKRSFGLLAAIAMALDLQDSCKWFIWCFTGILISDPKIEQLNKG